MFLVLILGVSLNGTIKDGLHSHSCNGAHVVLVCVHGVLQEHEKGLSIRLEGLCDDKDISGEG